MVVKEKENNRLFILNIILILIILGFVINDNINYNLNNIAYKECAIDYGYDLAIATTGGYWCYNVTKIAKLKELKEKE